MNEQQQQQQPCKYCGGKTHNGSDVCPNCFRKRVLVRKIRAMLMEAKREKERPKTACDYCRYGPCSFVDNKPCFMCPATPKG